MSKDREFLWRRLHSLLGVIPVGLFLVFHLSLNFTAVGGEQFYNDATGAMELVPHSLLLLMEWVIIYIPLMFHAFYGVFIAFTASPNTKRFGTYRNWMFSLQRFTGVFLVIFIAWHIFQTRIQKALGAEVDFNMMEEILANPFMLGFYIVRYFISNVPLNKRFMGIPSELGYYTISSVAKDCYIRNEHSFRNFKCSWCGCYFSVSNVEAK